MREEVIEAIKLVKGRLRDSCHGQVKVKVLEETEEGVKLLVVYPKKYDAIARAVAGYAAFDALYHLKVRVDLDFALSEI